MTYSVRSARIWIAAAACLWVGAGSLPDAHGQLLQPVKELERVGITEHLDAQLPLDAEFVDESGRKVQLQKYFTGTKPVILTLNYYSCPMLCNLQLNGLLDSLKELKYTPGKEFELVTVSFDPRETHTLARLKKQNYIADYGRSEAAAGWHFLTGRKPEIERLTQTVGFGYEFDETSQEYAHAAALILCTPDGRVSRYLYGVMYDTETLRLSLVEAGRGLIGSPLDQILLFCYHYDAARGRYAPAAMNLMRAGALLTVIVLSGALILLWKRDCLGKKPAFEGPQP